MDEGRLGAIEVTDGEASRYRPEDQAVWAGYPAALMVAVVRMVVARSASPSLRAAAMILPRYIADAKSSGLAESMSAIGASRRNGALEAAARIGSGRVLNC